MDLKKRTALRFLRLLGHLFQILLFLVVVCFSYLYLVIRFPSVDYPDGEYLSSTCFVPNLKPMYPDVLRYYDVFDKEMICQGKAPSVPNFFRVEDGVLIVNKNELKMVQNETVKCYLKYLDGKLSIPMFNLHRRLAEQNYSGFEFDEEITEDRTNLDPMATSVYVFCKVMDPIEFFTKQNKGNKTFKYKIFKNLQNMERFLKYQKGNEIPVMYMPYVYQNVFLYARPQPEKVVEESKYGVVIIIQDSMSRLNWMRSMPETYKFLKDDFTRNVIFRGVNVVEKNTFPNLFGLMTGRNYDKYCPERILELCRQTFHEFLPHPWIFQRARELNFTSTFIEDWYGLGLFTYQRAGWMTEPFDYHYRIGMEVLDRLSKTYANRKDFQKKTCALSNNTYEVVYRVLSDLLSSVSKRARHFAIVGFARITHEYLNGGQLIDNEFKVFLKDKLFSKLNKSFVFIMGDHGFRKGQMYDTEEFGMLEVKKPFLAIRVPANFRDKHKIAYENLKKNSNINKLTTWFDFHAMLKDIIEGTISNPSKTERGISPFQEIKDRNCREAYVPKEYCGCYYPIDKSGGSSGEKKKVLDITEALVKYINKKLKESKVTPANMTCRNIKLKSVIRAKMEVTTKIMYILFNVYPTNALFEITAASTDLKKLKNNETMQRRLNDFSVTRMDESSYEDTQCSIPLTELESFCLCKLIHPNNQKTHKMRLRAEEASSKVM